MAQGAGGGGSGGEPPKASDANPPAAVQGTPGESRSAPGNDMTPGRRDAAARHRNARRPGWTTGNMNTKGAGPRHHRNRPDRAAAAIS